MSVDISVMNVKFWKFTLLNYDLILCTCKRQEMKVFTITNVANTRRFNIQVRKMYRLDANNFIMILFHKWPLHVSDIYMSIFRSSYMLFHCRMWCYAL